MFFLNSAYGFHAQLIFISIFKLLLDLYTITFQKVVNNFKKSKTILFLKGPKPGSKKK